jgi:hypothetical protein
VRQQELDELQPRARPHIPAFSPQTVPRDE